MSGNMDEGGGLVSGRAGMLGADATAYGVKQTVSVADGDLISPRSQMASKIPFLSCCLSGGGVIIDMH